jgi:hypothetical protein
MEKRILWAHPNSKESCEESVITPWAQKHFPSVVLKFYDNTFDAIQALDSEPFNGVHITDMRHYPLTWCDEHAGLQELYERLNQTEKDSLYGGALYLARYAIEKGLPVLAQSTDDERIGLLRAVGAEVTDYNSLIPRFREVLLK